MKDEIKEILEDFKIYEDRYKKCNETQFIIFYRDVHLLLDYIINLQEENERLKERENKLQEKFKDWKKEIEKEKKYYLCDRTDCCGRIKNSKKI